MTRSLTALLLTVSGLICWPAFADKGDADAADAEPTWVTSITPIGDSQSFAASTATGLLLRPADVVTFDPANPDALTKLYDHPAAVWCVQSTSDGKKLASVDYRGNLVVFDVDAAKPQLHEAVFERWCQSMSISPDDQHVVAGNEAGKVLSWSLAESKVAKSVELDGHSVTGLAFSPDGKTLAASDGGGHVHLLSWPNLEQQGKIEISEATAWCVAFADGGQNLLVGSSDRHLYRCPAKADTKAESIAQGSDWITELAVSPDGQVAAGEVGGKLHFPAAGSVDSMNAKSGVWALCWNGSGQLLAGTRKHGIVSASRSWKWTPQAPAKKEAATKDEKAEPAETENTEGDSPKEADKPAEKSDKPAKEADKPAKEADKPGEKSEKPSEESDKPGEKDSK